ncbi:FadR family transcriptional regulator [Agrobacterium rhizogenes]|uniref:FadR/GntR family transcriptional regulator n=1 Tax=Rhizobium rhizogenes TaxID=359 RepID=UPI0015720549|nr:FCD domain-containing protein [Rhizobium rhizogenes]NTH16770.1 FadR family transcriptional regulator [Rhizobium rhizogenes]
MSYPLSTISRSPSVERTIDNIRGKIEHGVWLSGEPIPTEPDLVIMLRVAPHTVREALRILSRIGVLQVRHNKGIFVDPQVAPGDIAKRLSLLSLRDHSELRVMFEAEIARRAARNRTDADMENLSRLLADRGEASDHQELEDFIACDLAFHEAIARMSGNEELSEFYCNFTLTIDANMQTVLAGPGLPEPGLPSHRHLVSAIKDRDPDAAANAAQAITAPLLVHLSSLLPFETFRTGSGSNRERPDISYQRQQR